jgi:hypothetical protein
MPPERPRLVECHRAEVWPRMRRVLLLGPSVLTLGGLVIAASFLTHQPRALRVDATLAGLLLVAGGASSTMVGMQRILRDDRYLAIRTDGLFVQSVEEGVLVPWEELTGATWDDPRRELVLLRESAPPLSLFGSYAGIEGAALVGRVLSAKRKAAMNLLR